MGKNRLLHPKYNRICKRVVAKVTLVPCYVNITGKRDKVSHGEVTINSARIITELCLKRRPFYCCCGKILLKVTKHNICWGKIVTPYS